MPPFLRYLWAAPASLPGLVLAGLALMSRGRVGLVDGVLEVHGGAAAWVLRRCVPIRGGARAMTLGHVVVGRTPVCLEATRVHERVHVRQAERWGPFFLPAYLLASGWVFLRGGDPYRDNPFEREAFATACIPPPALPATLTNPRRPAAGPAGPAPAVRPPRRAGRVRRSG